MNKPEKPSNEQLKGIKSTSFLPQRKKEESKFKAKANESPKNNNLARIQQPRHKN